MSASTTVDDLSIATGNLQKSATGDLIHSERCIGVLFLFEIPYIALQTNL